MIAFDPYWIWWSLFDSMWCIWLKGILSDHVLLAGAAAQSSESDSMPFSHCIIFDVCMYMWFAKVGVLVLILVPFSTQLRTFYALFVRNTKRLCWTHGDPPCAKMICGWLRNDLRCHDSPEPWQQRDDPWKNTNKNLVLYSTEFPGSLNRW